jgi:hypothetical protein
MKAFRIVLLLCLFVFVAFYSKLQRLESMGWADSLEVSIYPINADGSESTDHYIQTLTTDKFGGIETFFNKQWGDYHEVDFQPVTLTLKSPVLSQPPSPPTDGHVINIMLWSLRLRLWSFQNSVGDDKSTVTIYVRYFSVNNHEKLAHSLGLQKGLVGVVNGYASDDYQEQNHVVIAHELLHTVGATDKYDLTSGQPLYPTGFAVPSARYSQTKAEIMAGRIPINEKESMMPSSLRQCVIGHQTATEIGWLDGDV